MSNWVGSRPAPIGTPSMEKFCALFQWREWISRWGPGSVLKHIPRFLEDQKRSPTDARVRTINAMFGHVGLDPKEITELGNEEAQNQRRHGQQPTPEMIAKDQRAK